ncbi:MAG: VWA domain-containing protein [Deltaproteobacteria bacterium]|nr:VWA domain-containing protein [Deltaproteobacteria bacterium]
MLRVEDPLWLSGLLLLPALAWLLGTRRARPALRIPSLGPLTVTRPSLVARTAWLPLGLELAALASLIVGLSRPQLGFQRPVREVEALGLVLAMDVSDTMAALDFRSGERRISRLEAAKSAAKRFVAGRREDLVGLVAFGAEAHTRMPTTSDLSAVTSAIDALDVGAAGFETALGDAVALAVKRLRGTPTRTRVAILLSDGRSNAGQVAPALAAQLAASFGVKVYAIGIGSRGPAPFEVEDPLGGRMTVLRNLDLDESTLGMIAAQTGGRYFRAETAGGLEEIYRTIDALEKTKVRLSGAEVRRELYPAFAGAAVLLLLLSALAAATLYLEVP